MMRKSWQVVLLYSMRAGLCNAVWSMAVKKFTLSNVRVGLGEPKGRGDHSSSALSHSFFTLYRAVCSFPPFLSLFLFTFVAPAHPSFLDSILGLSRFVFLSHQPFQGIKQEHVWIWKSARIRLCERSWSGQLASLQVWLCRQVPGDKVHPEPLLELGRYSLPNVDGVSESSFFFVSLLLLPWK